VLCGCDNVNRSLVFYTNTNVGLDVGVDPTTSSGKVQIGYSRQEGVVNPVYQPPPSVSTVVESGPTNQPCDACNTVGGNAACAECKDTPQRWTRQKTYGKEWRPVDEVYRGEAYSVIAKIAGEARGRAGQGAAGADAGGGLAQWFATGQAAIEIAKNPATAGAVVGNAAIAQAATGAKVAPRFQSEITIDRLVELTNLHADLRGRAEQGDTDAALVLNALDAEAERTLPILREIPQYKRDSNRRDKYALNTLDPVAGESLAGGGFDGLLAYVEAADKGKAMLGGAFASTKPLEIDGEELTVEQRRELFEVTEQYNTALETVRRAIVSTDLGTAINDAALEWASAFVLSED
jgi:hypothetical protein